VLVVQRVFRAKRTNLHEKYDYPYGESVTFRSGGQLFTWTFNGLDRRAVDVSKIAPAGFPTKPLVVYVGLNPANRR
jgi:hypothetical protein